MARGFVPSAGVCPLSQGWALGLLSLKVQDQRQPPCPGELEGLSGLPAQGVPLPLACLNPLPRLCRGSAGPGRCSLWPCPRLSADGSRRQARWVHLPGHPRAALQHFSTVHRIPALPCPALISLSSTELLPLHPGRDWLITNQEIRASLQTPLLLYEAAAWFMPVASAARAWGCACMSKRSCPARRAPALGMTLEMEVTAPTDAGRLSEAGLMRTVTTI